MSVVQIIPRCLPGGFVVDVSHGHPDVGGFDVFIWRNANRDDGMLINVISLKEARQLLAAIIAEGKQRGYTS